MKDNVTFLSVSSPGGSTTLVESPQNIPELLSSLYSYVEELPQLAIRYPT
jgi:hypothetical protein